MFDSLVSPDEWSESNDSDAYIMPVAAIQLCDPSRATACGEGHRESVRSLARNKWRVQGKGAGAAAGGARLDGSDLEAVTTRAHQGQPEDGHQASASPVELGSGEAEKKAGPA